MRVLFFADSFDKYGAQKSLREIVAYFAKKGVQCLVVAPGSGPTAADLRNAGASVSCMRHWARLLPGKGAFAVLIWIIKLLMNICQFLAMIGMYRPAVVYTNCCHSAAAAIAAKIAGVPHIWHIRTNFKTSPYKPTAHINWLAKALDLLSDRIVFVSRLALASVYPNDCPKAVTVHNGIDTDVFRPRVLDGADGRSVNNKDLCVRLGFFGAVRHIKGLDILLRAIALVRENHANICLDVWGDLLAYDGPEYMEYVKELCAGLGISDLVRFNGYCEKTSSVLPDYDLIVVPSRTESFSRVTLEAMSCGVPVVAAACGGPEELIEDGVTGRIVPVEDHKALAKAIIGVLEDPVHATSMANAARKKAQAQFDLTAQLNKILNLICEVSQKHPIKRPRLYRGSEI